MIWKWHNWGYKVLISSYIWSAKGTHRSCFGPICLDTSGHKWNNNQSFQWSHVIWWEFLFHSIVEMFVGNDLCCNLYRTIWSFHISPITWNLWDSSSKHWFGSSYNELPIKVKYAKTCQLETASQSQFPCHPALV